MKSVEKVAQLSVHGLPEQQIPESCMSPNDNEPTLDTATPNAFFDDLALGVGNATGIVEEEPGPLGDAEAMAVSLQKVNHEGIEYTEVYAHGEVTADGGSGKSQKSVLLARVSESALIMFPLVSASYRDQFLESKYGDLARITILADKASPWHLPESIRDFDGMLESLPVGFGRHAQYGLGFKWEYRLIPQAIRGLVGITELVIEPGDGVAIRPPKFHLGIDRFQSIRRSMDSITNRARLRSLKDRTLLAHNELLHAADPSRFERLFPKVKPGEIYKLVSIGGKAAVRNAVDRRAAATVIRDDAAHMAAEQPRQLMELRSVIEQVTLAELVSKFEELLEKRLPESKWQSFFKANPFILSLAFPHPVFLIQDQAHVGGTMLRGSGESIVDFLFAQRFTGSLALIEIKRPSTSLIESKTFRGDLHAPHKDLTSAIAQVLDQRYQLLTNFAAKSQDPLLKDTHVSAVHCIVVAGIAPSTIEGKRSLDLFRNSSKDVAVVTFDELLERLKEILRLMSAGANPSSDGTARPLPVSASAASPSGMIDDNDIPF